MEVTYANTDVEASAFDVDAKRKEIKRRRRQLSDMSRAVKVDAANVGKGGVMARVCAALASLIYRKSVVSVDKSATSECNVVASSMPEAPVGSLQNFTMMQRITGTSRSKSEGKLQHARAAMQARIEQLDQRSKSYRMLALKTAQSAKGASVGSAKQEALRLLKKAKAVEVQIASSRTALDAVDQQIDLMEQAVMQRQLTSALTATSKEIKVDPNAVSKVEDAMDAAIEARDVTADISAAMREFSRTATTEEADDDDLLAELQSMMGDAPDVRSRADAGAEEVPDMPRVPVEEDSSANGVEKRAKGKQKNKEESTPMLSAQ